MVDCVIVDKDQGSATKRLMKESEMDLIVVGAWKSIGDGDGKKKEVQDFEGRSWVAAEDLSLARNRGRGKVQCKWFVRRSKERKQ